MTSLLPVEARDFFDLEPLDGERGLRWRLVVRPELSTPGAFLFGGCGLGAGLVALEAAAGRPTVAATAQYVSFAATGDVVDYEVELLAVGKHVTQGRATARVGTHEILTVSASLGSAQPGLSEVWDVPPDVPPPQDCPERRLPTTVTASILDHVDVRVASGRLFGDLDGSSGSARSALWARVPGHLSPSAATLAVFGDYVSGGASQPIGRPTSGRSLDNTLRVVQLAPCEWVLCDIRMHAAVSGYAHGEALLWSPDGELLATASQSFAIRLWEPSPR